MSVDLLNSLLDSTVDDLQDLPVFKARPDGTYKAQFQYEIEEGEKYPYFKFTLKLIEIIELVDPKRSEEIDFSKDPKIVLMAFPFNKEGESSAFGEGLVKLIVKGLKESFGGNNNRETLEAANGGLVAITVKTKKQKDKDTKEVRENNELVAIMGIDG